MGLLEIVMTNKLDDNCLFDSNKFISKPSKSETCTIDENVLQLQYPLLNQNKLYQESA